MASILELERQLAEARERCERAAFDWMLDAEVLRLERELAAAKGEEYAVPLDFPVQWDTGASLPHLVVNDSRALLSFYVLRRRARSRLGWQLR